MPLIAWINDIFLKREEPYTIVEITLKLQQLYHPDISRDTVFRAYHSLAKRPVMAPLVAPLDDGRPMMFSADAARRIARMAAQNIEPASVQERAEAKAKPAPPTQSQTPQQRRKPKIPNSSPIPRVLVAKPRKQPLVRR